MKKILSFVLAASFVTTAFSDDLARVWNTTSGDKATAIVGLGYAGTDGKTYVLQKDPAIAGLPVNIVAGGITAGAIKYTRNGAEATVTYDGTTAANNRPLPVELHAGDASASIATGAGSTSSSTVRVVLPTDQSAIPVSQSGSWSVTLPTGASTSALQTTGNTSLSSIDTKTPALGQALAASSVPVVLTAAQLSTLTPLSTVAVSGISGTVSLPTGAATSALQTTGNTSLSSLDTKAVQQALGAGSVATSVRTYSIPGNVSGIADFAAGASSAQTLRVQLANESLPNLGTSPVQITSATVLPYVIDMASTNLTTSYLQLVASTGAAINKCEFFNGSGTPLYFAIGAAASEVVQYVIPPGGSTTQVSLRIASGSRLAVRTFTGTLSTGYFIANCGG